VEFSLYAASLLAIRHAGVGDSTRSNDTCHQQLVLQRLFSVLGQSQRQLQTRYHFHQRPARIIAKLHYAHVLTAAYNTLDRFLFFLFAFFFCILFNVLCMPFTFARFFLFFGTFFCQYNYVYYVFCMGGQLRWANASTGSLPL